MENNGALVINKGEQSRFKYDDFNNVNPSVV